MKRNSQDQTPAEFGPGDRRTSQLHPDIWIYAAALVALALKLCLAFNTTGTNDVDNFRLFAGLLHEQGLEWTYTHVKAFNHPPLVGYGLMGLAALDVPALQQNGFSFPFFLRLPGIIADLLVVVLLTVFRRELSLPRWSLIALALSPVSLMVSGFHGNTDPVMVLFLVLAACTCLRERPLLCGIFLAFSCQIKIIPLLVLPLFACFWFRRRKTAPFAWSFVAVTLVCWLLPLIKLPALVLKNVFAYGSFWGLWGISYWLRYTGWSEFSVTGYHHLPLAEHVVSAVLKVLIVGCVLLLAWRRRSVSARGFFNSLALSWIIFFIFSPGIAPQYMVWLAPFVLVLSPSAFAYLMCGSALFLFFFYNTLTAGLPWDHAVSTISAVDRWSPWALWPWAILIVTAVVLWRQATAANPSLRLLSLASFDDR